MAFRHLPKYLSLPSAQLWPRIRGLSLDLFNPLPMLWSALNSGSEIARLRPKLSSVIHNALFSWQFLARVKRPFLNVPTWTQQDSYGLRERVYAFLVTTTNRLSLN